VLWPIAAGLLIALAAVLWPHRATGPAPFMQITSDNILKNTMNWPPPIQDAPLATDGTRLYFTVAMDASAGPGVTPAQVSINGGEIAPIRLPFSEGGSQLMGISPDGTELLVEHYTAAEVEVPYWIVPALGGSPRRVGDVLAHDVAWSPDKRLFAFAIADGLFVVDANNSKRKIFSGGVVMWPRWSPDGKRLRFTVEDSATWSSAIWEIDADGKRPHLLLPGWNKPAIECCGEWTRDGRDFVFQTGTPVHFNIWAIHEGLFGHIKPMQITSGPLSFSAPLPSIDGKWLYLVGTQHRSELVKLDRSSGLGTLVTSFPSVKFLDYSRDGKWITYVTDPDGILWRSRVDGSDRLQLTYSPVVALSPRFSPDGTKIAFTALRVGKAANRSCS
jgi:Tol biopolymer transport system component